MYMRTATVDYTIYTYDELSDSAKWNAKQWYLDFFEQATADDFTCFINESLNELFGDNDLHVQYSLCHCQGDGLNVYGSIGADAIFKYADNSTDERVRKYADAMTSKDRFDIMAYANECGNIKIPKNRRDCYSELEWGGYKNINEDALIKLENLVRYIFTDLCAEYEDCGYDLFYEISDEDMSDICKDNGWEFTKCGELF